MKLTQTDRVAFVNAVIRDVPIVDYQEQAHKLLNDIAATLLPPEIQAIWNNPKLRSYIKHNDYISTPSYLDGVYGPASFTPNEEVKRQLLYLANKNKAQKDVIAGLRSKLTGMITGCSTLKQATDLMPEFSKYLPKERQKVVPGVPALVSVVAELHDLGWPKGSVATS